MGKSNAASNSLLNLIFQGTEWTGVARNDTSPVTTLYIALHTADPTDEGNQSSNECTYTGYARVGIDRDGSGWTTAVSEVVSPQAAITFPTGTGGFGVADFFSIGLQSTGAGEILYSGPVTPSITTGNGVTPQLGAGTVVFES